MKYIIPAVIIIIALAVFLYLENTILDNREYPISYSRLPEGFDGYRIAHLSDVHNTLNRRLQASILQSLREHKPDIIVITGDLLDSRRTNVTAAVSFIERLAPIAPVYYVPGNHEGRIPEAYRQFHSQCLGKPNITLMEDESLVLTRNNDHINLIGLSDPHFNGFHGDEKAASVKRQLERFIKPDEFNMLLIHRPELIRTYGECGVDLALTGHAHGGQIRLPFVGGLFAPGQGLLPWLTSDVHEYQGCQLVISRGIGNSLAPFRIFNHPEVIIITLNKNERTA